MSPERIAADIIRRVVGADGVLRGATPEAIGRTAVEHISLAGLVIAPAARMAALLEVERAAALLRGAEVSSGHVRGTDFPTITLMLPEGEYDRRDDAADALVAALIEVAA